MPPPVQPDPRILAMISHALDHGIYTPGVNLALVQCFYHVFGDTEWWRDMLDNEPAIAALVHVATTRTLH